MTVSAPQPSETVSFCTSSPSDDVVGELPMFELIFTRALSPIAIGSSAAVIDVRGNDHAAAGDLGAHKLGIEVLALGDPEHLRGEHLFAGEAHLRNAFGAGGKVGPVSLLHSCSLRWHDPDQVLRVGVVAPSQPLTRGSPYLSPAC